MKKGLIGILIALLTLGFLAPVATAEDRPTVEIAYVEWACARASTNMVQAVLQERMGYDCETVAVSAAAMWQAVASGDVDGMVTAWLPVTHEDYLERFKDDVVDLGPLSTGAKLGWVVPKYVPINSIKDINNNAKKFDGKVIGIDPGSGLMRLSNQAMDDYDLDKMTLVDGSGATMTAALGNAIRNKDWVVVTLWSPHWAFGRWDLKYLEDPKGVLGGEETINTIVRKGLKKDMPDVYEFLDRFYWNPADHQTVMAWNEDAGADAYENAVRFMKENPSLVDIWVGTADVCTD